MTKRVGLLLLPLLVCLAACGSIPERRPVPEKLVELATVPGIPQARSWGDVSPQRYEEWLSQSREELKANFPALLGREHNYLALSGGGSNGAFGAGLLCGWTQAGTRPEFAIVTGISTGALIAPFAFLGPDYDAQLRKAYTTIEDADIFTMRGALAGLTSDGLADTTGLRKMIAELISAETITAIAREHRRGRRLIVGTTNLDTGRPVHWDLGAIAASGADGAKDLLHAVLLASASLPVFFPPVLIEVEAEGESYDEIHVDGGVTCQVFFLSSRVRLRDLLEKLEVPGKPNLYVIRNADPIPDWQAIDPPGVVLIGGRTVQSLIRTQGIGDLYRMFVEAERDGLAYHLAVIPDEFREPREGEFDKVYMNKLFELGFEQAKGGYSWLTAPPDL